MSHISLVCTECGRSHRADMHTLGCGECGAPLDVEYKPDAGIRYVGQDSMCLFRTIPMAPGCLWERVIPR